MRIITLLRTIAVFAFITSFTNTKKLVVTSSAFTNNGMIPTKYKCLGQTASPPINISNIPEGTRSLAMIVDDPDGPVIPKARPETAKGHKRTTSKRAVPKAGAAPVVQAHECTVHWLIWNLELDGNIPENFKNDYEGINSGQQVGYIAMCPPTGTHHYHFKVYALDVKLNIPRKSDKATLEKVMEGHILATGELVGTFNKTYRQ